MKKSILVTGGLGFVGGRLSRYLSEEFSVLASSRTTPTAGLLKAHGNVQPILHEKLLLREEFPNDIQTVIHLAALNEIDSVKYPSEAISVNIDETRIILENAIAAGTEKFIFFSTAHVYASPLRGIIEEENLPLPIHPYAITHKAAEDFVLAAGLQKKIKTIILRLSNSFGAPVSPDVNRWTLLANDLCRQAVEKGRLKLLSNGCQYRDFVCLSDVERTLSAIVSAGPEHFNRLIYNLGAGKSMRVKEMAELIASSFKTMTGKDLAIEFPAGATESKEHELVFDISRLISEGIQIKNDFKEEIKQLLDFCFEYFHPID